MEETNFIEIKILLPVRSRASYILDEFIELDCKQFQKSLTYEDRYPSSLCVTQFKKLLLIQIVMRIERRRNNISRLSTRGLAPSFLFLYRMGVAF